MVKSTAKRRSASPAAERAIAESDPTGAGRQSSSPPPVSSGASEARSTARPLPVRGEPNGSEASQAAPAKAPSAKPEKSAKAKGQATKASLKGAAGKSSEKKSSKGKTDGAESDADGKGPRRFRGAAPWAARHAAKRAAEFAARNQEPPRPGSARATLRTPEQAESIKARVTELHQLLNALRATKKHLKDRFTEAGELLRRLRDERLFEAKGYTSFESFVEREIDLGSKTFALRLVRVVETFVPAAAREIGLEPLLAALDTLDQAAAQQSAPRAIRPPGRP